ncbi:uncharacterized protein LOC128722644 [Anopheles nili]|uniref:uncharacterized protein LOC128722644 n=1 Tax=Anopheles nili TaxID=185578 RepID=UPI00237BA92E|nr:uncharacterized protein LOC128722644 [Anopheles nili]
MPSKLSVISEISEKFSVYETHVCPFRVSSQSSVVDDAEEFETVPDPRGLLEGIDENEIPQTVSERYRLLSYTYGATAFEAVEDLLKSIEQNPSADVKLDFNRRGYTSLHVQIALDSLLQLRPECLTSLDLSRNRLINPSLARLLGSVLQELQAITYLALSYNVLNDECIRLLADPISNSGVRRLEASHCQISDKGGSLLFAALAYSDCIEVVDIRWNHLKYASGVAVGRFLTTQKTVKELILSGNHLHPQSKCIVPLLLGAIGNESLEQLDLSWNSLRGDEFGRALVKAISQTKLRRLNLEHNMLTGPEMSFVLRLLKKSESLEQLWLGGNTFEDEDIMLDFVRTCGRHPTFQLLSFGRFQFISQRAGKLCQFFMRKNPIKTFVYQGVLLAKPPRPVDVPEMLLERCRFLAQKPKRAKQKRDLGHLMLQFASAEDTAPTREDFVLAVKRFRVKLDRALLEALMNAFEGPQKSVDVGAMALKYLTKHPTEPPVTKPKKSKGKPKTAA